MGKKSKSLVDSLVLKYQPTYKTRKAYQTMKNYLDIETIRKEIEDLACWEEFPPTVGYLKTHIRIAETAMSYSFALWDAGTIEGVQMTEIHKNLIKYKDLLHVILTARTSKA